MTQAKEIKKKKKNQKLQKSHIEISFDEIHFLTRSFFFLLVFFFAHPIPRRLYRVKRKSSLKSMRCDIINICRLGSTAQNLA